MYPRESLSHFITRGSLLTVSVRVCTAQYTIPRPGPRKNSIRNSKNLVEYTLPSWTPLCSGDRSNHGVTRDRAVSGRPPDKATKMPSRPASASCVEKRRRTGPRRFASLQPLQNLPVSAFLIHQDHRLLVVLLDTRDRRLAERSSFSDHERHVNQE